jgi:hypothetical protein
MGQFEQGDRVSKTVKDGQNLRSRIFLIHDHRITDGKHEYQLREELSGAILEQGKWFAETELDYR